MKNKCKCNRDARVQSIYEDWYCWDCFIHFEEEQRVREQAQPNKAD